MSKELDKIIQEYVETPESFRNVVEQRLAEERAKRKAAEADGQIQEQVQPEIQKVIPMEAKKGMNKTHRRKWNGVKVAAVACALICLMSGGVYAVTRMLTPEMIDRPVDETVAEKYVASDGKAINQTITPGWPQTMRDVFGEEREKDFPGVEEPTLNITEVYYDGLSLIFYGQTTEYGKAQNLNADRIVIGDAIFMMAGSKISADQASYYTGTKEGDFVGKVELGGAELPNDFRAEMVLNVSGQGVQGVQNVAFDVHLDERSVIKPAKTVTIAEGVQATVDALKIAASGSYIHVTWEFDESQKDLYDQLKNEEVDVMNKFVFMSLDDNNGNHFTTEENGDFSQSIVVYADGRDDWSGTDQNKFYEENGKYYLAMGCIIGGMTEDVTSLTIKPYEKTRGEEKTEHSYTDFDFAAFTVNYE